MQFLLDTNIVIYLQKGELDESLPLASYGISVISEMELLSYPMLSNDDIEWLHKFIKTVEVVELTKAVKDSAIGLRRSYRLRLPDAIVVASALIHDAVLLTNDQQLGRVAELKIQSVKLKQI